MASENGSQDRGWFKAVVSTLLAAALMAIGWIASETVNNKVEIGALRAANEYQDKAMAEHKADVDRRINDAKAEQLRMQGEIKEKIDELSKVIQRLTEKMEKNSKQP